MVSDAEPHQAPGNLEMDRERDEKYASSRHNVRHLREYVQIIGKYEKLEFQITIKLAA